MAVWGDWSGRPQGAPAQPESRERPLDGFSVEQVRRMLFIKHEIAHDRLNERDDREAQP